MGVSHPPGFGLLGTVPRSLSTQPPFATQALILVYEPVIFLLCFVRLDWGLVVAYWTPALLFTSLIL